MLLMPPTIIVLVSSEIVVPSCRSRSWAQRMPCSRTLVRMMPPRIIVPGSSEIVVTSCCGHS